MLLHEIEHALAHEAQAAHRFVQRHVGFKPLPAELFVAMADFFACAGGQPVSKVLQQNLSPLAQFGFDTCAVVFHLRFAADSGDNAGSDLFPVRLDQMNEFAG